MNSSCHCHLQPLLVPTPAKTRSPTPNRTPNHRCSSHVLSIDPVVLPAGWTRRTKENFILWGGDVARMEAHQASLVWGKTWRDGRQPRCLVWKNGTCCCVFTTRHKPTQQLFAKFIPSFPTNHEPVTESRFLVRYLKGL